MPSLPTSHAPRRGAGGRGVRGGVKWGAGRYLQTRRAKVGRAQLPGRGGCARMQERLRAPLSGARPGCPVPGVPVNLHEPGSNTSRPLITGPSHPFTSETLGSRALADCIFFPVVNCDLCVYVKKTRTLLSCAYRPGSQLGFAQTLIFLVICSGWRVSRPRGGHDGTGVRFPAVPQPVSGRWGFPPP